MEKADYSKIADTYDQARHLKEHNLELWLGLISKHSRAPAGARVLDLGCGTGRFTLPMAARLGYEVTGADFSQQMLAKAHGKDREDRVVWDFQNAQCLTYDDATFDAVFLSHLLHHVDVPPRVIGECHRVLRTPGAVLIHYGAIELIRDDVEHVFFPDAVAIDEARTPSVAQTEQWLREAGFADVATHEVAQQTYATPQERLKAVKARSTSVLTLIPPEAFAKGVRQLDRYIGEKPDNPWLLFDQMALTVGYKRP